MTDTDSQDSSSELEKPSSEGEKSRRACFPSFEGVPSELFINICKGLGVREMKVLRELNKDFNARMLALQPKLFSYWRFKRLSGIRFVEFADDENIKVVAGIEVECGKIGRSAIDDVGLLNLLSKRPEVESIKISGSSCTDQGLESALIHSKLIVLHLDKSKEIKGRSLNPDLESSKLLKELSLKNCGNLTDVGAYGILAKVSGNLTSLSLSGNCLTFAKIDTVPVDLSSLEKLDLSSNTNLTDIGFHPLMNKLGVGLKELDLSRTGIALERTAQITVNFSQLERLVLSQCKGIRNESCLLAFVDKFVDSLKILDIGFNGITLVSVDTHVSQFRCLEVLSLTGIDKLDERGFVSLINKCGRSLKKLYLGYTSITLTEVGLLTTDLPNLELLHLDNCVNISLQNLTTLLSKTRDKLKLSISRCQLDEASIKASFPSINIIS